MRAQWIVAMAVAAWLALPAPAAAQCGPNFVELFNPGIGRFECGPAARPLLEQIQRRQQAERLELLRKQDQNARQQLINEQRQIRRQRARQRRLLRQQQRLQAR